MQNQSNKIIEIIKSELSKPLPGEDFQRKMIPKSRLTELRIAPENVRQGAVLILLYESEHQLMTTFIVRTDDGGVHSGQISFPGGKYEDADNNLVITALREANEEIGIDTKNVTVLGNLSAMYIPVSNFKVTPVVGYYTGMPVFNISPAEVAGLIHMPLAHFIDENNRGLGTVDVRGNNYEVPVFKAGTHQIWGATAMILSEFVQVLKNINGDLSVE